MSKYSLFFIIIFGLQSCKKTIVLKAAENDKIEVIYKNGQLIDFKIKGIYEKSYVNIDTIIFHNGEYYLKHSNTDSTLFLSTIRDKLYQENADLDYEYEIKKLSNDTFSSTSRLIREDGIKIDLQNIFYTKNYQIFKIKRIDKNYIKD